MRLSGTGPASAAPVLVHEAVDERSGGGGRLGEDAVDDVVAFGDVKTAIPFRFGLAHRAEAAAFLSY